MQKMNQINYRALMVTEITLLRGVLGKIYNFDGEDLIVSVTDSDNTVLS